MAAAKAIWNELGANASAADPWMTTVGYFNAVRELAGMRRMAEDELRTKLRRTRFTTGLANRPAVDLKELTSRVSSDDIKLILRRLFVTHDPARDPDDERPVDLLLATNMISVGVDVPRLGSMVVVGQPKATAEYIQATSRVGRDPQGPGLVITLYNWARPRDLSHYETFDHYHATFYRHVEPLSVTPFSERALDKGLTGVLVSAVRHSDGDWNPNPSARSLNRPDQRITDHVDALAARAASVTGDSSVGTLVTDMANKRLDAWHRETGLRPDLSYAKRTAEDVALLWKPEAGDWDLWTCPNSLRDTEVQANLQIIEEDPTYESGSQPGITLGLPPDLGRPTVGVAVDEEIGEPLRPTRLRLDSPGGHHHESGQVQTEDQEEIQVQPSGRSSPVPDDPHLRPRRRGGLAGVVSRARWHRSMGRQSHRTDSRTSTDRRGASGAWLPSRRRISDTSMGGRDCESIRRVGSHRCAGSPIPTVAPLHGL